MNIFGNCSLSLQYLSHSMGNCCYLYVLSVHYIYYTNCLFLIGVPKEFLESESNSSDLASWPVSIMDYICEKFDGLLVETKTVRQYYWNKSMKDLMEKKVIHV